MLSYIIEGGRRLEGETFVSGSKNASLPIIAGTLLNGGISKLYNVPNIHDTQMMFEILKKLGCKVKKNNGKIIIDSKNITSYEKPKGEISEQRSLLIREELFEELEQMKEKYNLSIYKLVNIAIKNALEAGEK